MLGKLCRSLILRNKWKLHHRRPLLRGLQPNPVTMTGQATLSLVALLRTPKWSTVTLTRRVLLTTIRKRVPISPLLRCLSGMFPRQQLKRLLKKKPLL